MKVPFFIAIYKLPFECTETNNGIVPDKEIVLYDNQNDENNEFYTATTWQFDNMLF